MEKKFSLGQLLWLPKVVFLTWANQTLKVAEVILLWGMDSMFLTIWAAGQHLLLRSLEAIKGGRLLREIFYLLDNKLINLINKHIQVAQHLNTLPLGK
jgi:hypothetical protein